MHFKQEQEFVEKGGGKKNDVGTVKGSLF